MAGFTLTIAVVIVTDPPLQGSHQSKNQQAALYAIQAVQHPLQLTIFTIGQHWLTSRNWPLRCATAIPLRFDVPVPQTTCSFLHVAVEMQPTT